MLPRETNSLSAPQGLNLIACVSWYSLQGCMQLGGDSGDDDDGNERFGSLGVCGDKHHRPRQGFTRLPSGWGLR
jgi:hypothetical protein